MKPLTLLATLALALAFAVAASSAPAATTPAPLASAYSSLADTILGAKSTETNLVRAILDAHHAAAQQAMHAKDFDKAAAEMALFANEGDNTVGGIRKRLLEGGHHHNAEGETKGIYEPGYVVVTIAQKKEALDAVAALRAAKTDEARKAAWDKFDKVAGAALSGK